MKRSLSLMEFFGIVLVVGVIAFAVINIRSCTFTRTTTNNGQPSGTTVETTTTTQQ